MAPQQIRLLSFTYPGIQPMPEQDAASWPLAVAETAQASTITVWVGAPSGLLALADSGLHLVVEADPVVAQRCRTAWLEHPGLVVCDQVLAPHSDATVRWCLFNDARLNGPLDQQVWLHHYPNLRQVGEEQRLGCSLADLLTNVGRHLVDGPSTALILNFQQGDPRAALDGLGAWLECLHTVELALPSAAMALWAGPVGAWLEPRGFRACAGEAARWQRDFIASQRKLLQERNRALAQVHELETRLQQLFNEREALQAQSQQQKQQLDHFLRELDASKAALDQELPPPPDPHLPPGRRFHQRRSGATEGFWFWLAR